MTRWIALLGVGGCLLGWKPEGDVVGTDTSAETDADADTDADTDAGTETGCDAPIVDEPCAGFDVRTLDVGASLVPTFSSDRGFVDLYVYSGADPIWHIWANDDQNSLYTITYGEVLPGVTQAAEAIPLTDGGVYEVKLDAHCVDDQCADLSSFYETFTAGP